MLKISLTLGQKNSSAEDDYTYEYQEPDKDNLTKFDGNRLVGARAANMMEEVPFIVLVKLHSGSCTGVLLTASYVLTAAHCTKLIGESRAEELSLIRRCVQTGLRNYDKLVGVKI